MPADHDRQIVLVAAMRRPAFFPHETDPEIRLVQTHLSYVLLTGPYAYKINKCVRFSFADYSTLENRRHFCEEEIRLNRLYAPDLYLDVVGIYEETGNFTLSSTGRDPIEYAVRMRQFRDEDLLLQVFERGELPGADVEFIARRIAEFHRDAATDAAIAAYGAPDRVAAVARDNLEILARFTDGLWSTDGVERLRRFVEDAVQKNADLLSRRVEEGRVRECHGDLHLGNICYYDDKIEFFDRIVFNDAFKNIDVMYDLAFLYMDFEYRCRPDLANRLLNVYLEASNDFDGIRLMRFYACCRAQVRAKVFALESGEEEISADQIPEIEREAKAYFDLALQYAADPGPATVTIMCGVSGSGKSTVARELAAIDGAICFRSDTVRKHLGEGAANIYTREMTQRTYTFLTEVGVHLAAAGYSVILDATYMNRSLRQQTVVSCRARGIDVRILHCTADSATMERRVRERTGDVSDADVNVLGKQLEGFEPLTAGEQAIATKIDTTRRVDYSKL